ncbi:MAG: c-type cytochrome [Motiliproteus sp.]
MKNNTIGFCTAGVTALLLMGCGEEKKEVAPSVTKQEAVKSTAVKPDLAKPEIVKPVAESSTTETVNSAVVDQVEEKMATEVEGVKASAVAAASSGESIYNGLCFSCHNTGLAGAPKLGDKAAWAPRIDTGLESLYGTALNGKGAMPAKGGNPSLSDADVKATVDYMLSKVN